MNMLQTLGIGRKRLIRQGERIPGVVTDVKTCWWLKINTKPVRAHMWDGALFPHQITYRYTVDGREYPGKRIISPYAACPRTGDSVQVCYDARYPERSALITQPEDDH